MWLLFPAVNPYQTNMCLAVVPWYEHSHSSERQISLLKSRKCSEGEAKPWNSWDYANQQKMLIWLKWSETSRAGSEGGGGQISGESVVVVVLTVWTSTRSPSEPRCPWAAGARAWVRDLSDTCNEWRDPHIHRHGRGESVTPDTQTHTYTPLLAHNFPPLICCGTCFCFSV